MNRLSKEERSYRKAGAGVPIGRWWPVPIVFIGLIAATTDPFLLSRCIGTSLPIAHGKAAFVELGLTALCTPYLVTGGPWQWLWLALIAVPLPFAVINVRWMKGHAAYWKQVRAHEADLRRERKARKAQTADETPRSGDNSPVD